MNIQVVKTETLRSIANGSLSSSFAAVGTAFANYIRIMCVINNTDVDVILSDNGSTDKYFVPKNSFRIYDYSTNRHKEALGLGYPPGTQISARTTGMPSSGSLYIEAIYTG